MAALKHSRQRDAIRENLRLRRDHPTADMVYADIRKDYPSISLGTVYRNLALLTDLGEVRRLSTDDGADRYDGNLEPHDHFVCRCCREITDMPRVGRTELIGQAQEEFDGTIDDCRIVFYGTCGECRRKAAN